ncbi:LLM class flavin-dependent oxidoreductase [Amycolatopsis alkalitolerans]|uniref:LLM class flavin-dependent oxidoreductase n=1 Tax=Amycolatopsis alkalitolerans TaxID=2547244 RepID=A0A5C4M3S4_9PSEU|nr:LLM class flavin-dependent oxidoreductase [Amycolatopsis alkalitolerans]TNC27705.1 LLM class flavin-dependent oxidoreductase [Amycolatopsis alkalitolerans]
MRYAIALPQNSADGEFDPAAFRSYVQRAEALGFHSAWTQEQTLTLGGLPTLSPIETMTYAAAYTERLRLGCAVFVFPQHIPVQLAKSLATLDQLSRGRLEVGLGVGGRRPYAAFGHEGDALVARFTEGLSVMRALWTQRETTLDGRFWQLTGAAISPGPFQKPGPPVWFGGSHPNALKRAVRLGDGFFGAGSTTTEKFAEQVRIVRAERAGFPIAKRIYLAVDDNGDRARKQIADGLEAIYGTRGLEAVSVAGTPAECVRGVQEVADAGAELILFTTVGDQAEQMERLAAEVLPQLS